MAILEIKSTATLTIEQINIGATSDRVSHRQLHKAYYGQFYEAALELLSVTVSCEVGCKGIKLTCVISTTDTTTLKAMESIGERFGLAWRLEEQAPSNVIRRVWLPEHNPCPSTSPT